jgi:hypothetical protein
MKLEFSQQIKKNNIQILNFHENPLSGNCFMWADGWTDIMKLTVAFCNFTNVPKN